MKRASISFFSVIVFYLLLFVGALWWFGSCSEGRSSGIVSGIIVGSLYVLITFYYFYQNYFLPYVREDSAVKKNGEQRNVLLWVLSWTTPAILLQVFVVFGFWLTVDRIELSKTMYTHPFMYGQVYKKMMAASDLAEASLLKSGTDLEVESKEKYLDYLEKRFSPFVRHYVSKKEVSSVISNGVDPNSNLDEISTEIDELGKKLKSGDNKQEKLVAKESKKRLERLYKLAAQRGDPRIELEAKLHAIPFAIALTFGFLGALIYSLLDIVNRNSNSDLHIKTLIHYLVRYIFSLAICLVIAYFFMSNWQSNIAPVAFFLCGIFPQQALGYIVERARRSLRLEKRQYEEIPLEMLQGMTDYIAFRFRELGIGDVQNLAFCKLKRITDNMGFSDSMIADFVAQAMLAVYMKDDFRSLQNKAIRDIFCLKDILEKSKKKFSGLADFLNIEEQKLLAMAHTLENPRVQQRINELKEIMRLS